MALYAGPEEWAGSGGASHGHDSARRVGRSPPNPSLQWPRLRSPLNSISLEGQEEALKLLAIELLEGGVTPRFRLLSEDGPGVKIVGLLVSGPGLEEYLWAIAPPGYAVTIENARGVEYPASPNDPAMRQVEARFSAKVEAEGVIVSELTYGEVPPGLTQGLPTSGAAPPLVPGHTYHVLATGSAVGLLSFTA
jgi:hypothetical protein